VSYNETSGALNVCEETPLTWDDCVCTQLVLLHTRRQSASSSLLNRRATAALRCTIQGMLLQLGHHRSLTAVMWCLQLKS